MGGFEDALGQEEQRVYALRPNVFNAEPEAFPRQVLASGHARLCG